MQLVSVAGPRCGQTRLRVVHMKQSSAVHRQLAHFLDIHDLRVSTSEVFMSRRQVRTAITDVIV